METGFGPENKKKIQHFIWKRCNNCIPVVANIKSKGIQCEGMCSSYGMGEETIEHMVCKSAGKSKKSGTCSNVLGRV